eukprot:5048206-Pleurochrysis_carterae.AAC.2
MHAEAPRERFAPQPPTVKTRSGAAAALGPAVPRPAAAEMAVAAATAATAPPAFGSCPSRSRLGTAAPACACAPPSAVAERVAASRGRTQTRRSLKGSRHDGSQRPQPRERPKPHCCRRMPRRQQALAARRAATWALATSRRAPPPRRRRPR